MPLGTNVQENIKELYKDNKRKGKARGAGGKPRSRKQIIAIAFAAAKRGRKGRIRLSAKSHRDLQRAMFKKKKRND